MLCLILGGIGLVSIFFIHDHRLLLIPMIFVGLAWASTLTMPYSILAGALPPDKMGFYMGVFNFFIVIPQMVAAAILGFTLKELFSSQAIYAMIIGGISMVIAGLMNFIVRDTPDESATEIIEEVMISEKTPPSYI